MDRNTIDDLRSPLDTILSAYQKHFGVAQWTQPPYTIEVDGPDVQLTVEVDEKTHRTIAGRFSAFPFLAARYWGASHVDYDVFPIFIPTLFASQGRDGFESLERDCATALQQAAAWFAQAGEELEATLCLRRSALEALDDAAHYSVMQHEEVAVFLRDAIRPIRGTVPSSVLKNAFHVPDALLDVSRKDTWGLTSLAKHWLPHIRSDDAIERAFAVEGLFVPVHELRSNNALNLAKLVEEPLRERLEDPEPYLRERALAALEHLAQKLYDRQAYVEAAPLLSLLIDAGIQPREKLRWRWECRLAAEDHGAEEDWSLAMVNAPDGIVRIDPSMWSAGDVDDARGVGLTRIAQAHLAWAQGKDPCNDRRVKKAMAKAWQKRRDGHLQLAESHIHEALAIVEPRVKRDTKRTSKKARKADEAAALGSSVTYRGFQSDTYLALSLLHELREQLSEALAALERAREIREVQGLSWRIKALDDDLNRLRLAVKDANREKRAKTAGKKAGPKTVPKAFDGRWLLSDKVTPEKLRRCVEVWGLGASNPDVWKNDPSTGKNWAPYVERYFVELVYGATRDIEATVQLMQLFLSGVKAGGVLPKKGWIKKAQLSTLPTSPELAEALCTYIEYHLETCYQRIYTRDEASLFWPLPMVWDDSLEPWLLDYYRGTFDRRKASKSIRARRARLLGYVCEHVHTPALAKEIAR